MMDCINGCMVTSLLEFYKYCCNFVLMSHLTRGGHGLDF